MGSASGCCLLHGRVAALILDLAAVEAHGRIVAERFNSILQYVKRHFLQRQTGAESRSD
jgi:hypothetical protein